MRINTLVSQIVSFVLSLLILLGGGFGYWWLVHKPEPQASAMSVRALPLVDTEPVRDHGSSVDIVVDGVVAPFREIQFAAEVSGRISFKDEACNGGQFVSKGTRLIEIDPSDYRLEVQRLTSQFDQAEASLDELTVEISNTKELIDLAEQQVGIETTEVARLEDLVKRKVVTDSELDRAKQVELTSRNSLLQSQNQLHLLKTRQRRLESAMQLVATDLEKARLDLRRTEIVATVDGVVVEDLVEQDSYVQKGTPLFTLEDTSAVEVKCRLMMDELHWLWRQASLASTSDSNEARTRYQIPRMPVTVTYHLAGRDTVRFAWTGVLDRYDGIGLDEATRTVPCRVLVADPRDVEVVADDSTNWAAPPALVRGMYVTVTIHVERFGSMVLVPEGAVRPGKCVWVVRNGQLDNVQHLDLIERVERPNDDGAMESFWLVEASASRLTSEDRVVMPPFGILAEDDEVEESTDGEGTDMESSAS